MEMPNQEPEFRQPKPTFHGEENFKEWVEKKLGLPSVIWVPCKSGLRRFVAEEKEKVDV